MSARSNKARKHRARKRMWRWFWSDKPPLISRLARNFFYRRPHVFFGPHSKGGS